MGTRYPLNQSPLFKLSSRKKLAEMLKLSVKELEQMAAAQDSLYTRFPKYVGEKERVIERPKPGLRRVQKRLIRLLDRVQPPDYIHSGFRKRSYLTNASRHNCDSKLVKIDIRKFFPNAYAGQIYRAFVDVFHCSPDVAAVITRLTTAFGHLPTGGNSSTMLSYFAFKPMFDKIHQLAESRGLLMSCFVDDMTFSGGAATSEFLNEVRKIIQSYGLRTHKRRCFEAKQAKVVTGVALTPQGIRLPNARRKALAEALRSFDQEVDPFKRLKIGQELLGRATEAAQIEERFRPYISMAAKKLSEAKRALGVH